ncbi:MAG: hypothetical protein WC383_10525, partial [Gammaproteobacteria bacterium]
MRNGKTQGLARWGLLAMLCLGTATLTGCNSGDDGAPGPQGPQGPQGDPGITYLTDTIAASTEQCPTGGIVLRFGPDTNGDKVLNDN